MTSSSPPPLTPLIHTLFLTYLSFRQLYPSSFFQRRRASPPLSLTIGDNVLIQTTTNTELDSYLQVALSKLDEWHIHGLVQHVSLFITCSSIVVERLDLTLMPTPSSSSPPHNLIKTALIRFPTFLSSLRLPDLHFTPSNNLDFHVALCVDPNTPPHSTIFRPLPTPAHPPHTSPPPAVSTFLDFGIITVAVHHFLQTI